MADDDDLGLDGDDAGGAAPAKKRGGGGFLPKLLMIAALVVGAIILIVTIVIITMKLVGGNTTQQAVVPVTEEYSTKRELLDWYSSLGSIRTKTNDQEPATVTVDVVLGLLLFLLFVKIVGNFRKRRKGWMD